MEFIRRFEEQQREEFFYDDETVLGRVHFKDKNWIRNNRKLNMIKYRQLKFVLQNKLIKLTYPKIEEIKREWQQKIDLTIKSQIMINKDGYGH